MADKFFPDSGLPIRRTVELLPTVFQTPTNDKFLSAVLDPLVQPGVLQKTVGYIGRRYGKTYKGADVYLGTDQTLRSRYQLEPGVVDAVHNEVENFYDYLDFKNQLRFFGNDEEQDNLITSQEHYSWNPPINWDMFVNYREYYWEPSGPPAVQVAGQAVGITSAYKVSLGLNSFVFTPDGYTNNPTIKLFRGQTYTFKIDAPDTGFVIRTNYDVGTLTFKPLQAYAKGSVVIFNNKIWKATADIPAGTVSVITSETANWEYVDVVSFGTALDYNSGITNNRIENGTLTFEVPYDAPDALYYQSIVDPNLFGLFVIENVESNTLLDVEKDIIGKSQYLSSNGVEFTNGLVVEFLGEVTPSKYALDTWLVHGVGTEITLTKFIDLIVPSISSTAPEVLFDNAGFDTEPFDDAAQYPGDKDYITIAKDSIDKNPWSRYNRWFHRSVLEYAYKFRGQDFSAVESLRAKRPIIEFHPNIQLFNHGAVAKDIVDYIDDFTTDVFSNIEGSLGYSVDGEFLFEGARVLIIADTDTLANNKIYQVEFITHNGRKQIHLRETEDTVSAVGECVIVKRGNKNGGKMFHFDGTEWKESQAKTSVQQSPLFDAYDENEVSFSNTDVYPVSTFTGTKIISYTPGTGATDTELGFQVSYLNIDNVGDIQFDWNWDSDIFHYTEQQTVYAKSISTGFYKDNSTASYKNGWIKTNDQVIQPIIDSVVITESSNSVELDSIVWGDASAENTIINFYLNGVRLVDSYTRTNSVFTFNNTTFSANDVVSVKIVTDVPPNQGYYEIPVGLEKNPLNQELKSFTLGQAIDHILSAVEFKTEFNGAVPGVSNLRDISEYQQFSKRFVKHAGIVPLSISLLCDKTSNIIKSIQYAKKSYTEFKNNFLSRAVTIDYNDSIPNFVDDIIADLTKTRNENSPWADSDTIGSGAYTPINYVVDDTGIKTFSLSTKFSLTEISRKAVYVYLNNTQLLNGQDYEFNSTFGFITLKVALEENDVVEIREYVSTATNHIPPTPTTMGLYKKYTPMKFVDDTYVEPKEVIQGHDGSITFAFGDYRDDLLLELEYRIYNNIKTEYNPEIFDIDQIIGNYYGGGVFTKQQLDNITVQEFLKWIQNTNINYTLNSYFDSENSFTYTYSNMTESTGKDNLPGWWRGAYQWFYDTDRPHRCPWEMLGFSEKPEWWEDEYGPAPYTRNNLLLWEDLRDGIIRQGTRSGVYKRYQRPTLMSHIPVDNNGALLSPLDSGLATNFTLINNKGNFVLGDVSPVEYAWKSSSEYPFAMVIALSLLKPFEFIADNFDVSKTKINKIGQTVNVTTNRFFTLDNIKLPSSTNQTVGLVKYLAGYLKSRGLSVNDYESKLQNLTVSLSSRLSGFVDKGQQKYLLDSKSPKSTSSSIFVPPENYDIIFNVSAPISSISYSGVILEKVEGGWIVTGYDDIQPYFNYYEPLASQRDPLISVGGVSEQFLDWTEDKDYNNGQLIRYRNDFYRAIGTHNSGGNFDVAQWKKIPNVPTVGGIEAFRRKTFNTLNVSTLSYGTKLISIQQVVNFLLGYEEYLKSVGFKFDRYDPTIQSPQDWLTACKEFMFWTKHNWAIGSLITLSPAAERIDVSMAVGVADNLLDSFYEYQVLKGDGNILPQANIDVTRSFQNLTVSTVNTTEGIYYIKVHFVLKEHVVLFSDRTVFNDVIYDKTTGYRQERIKTQGFLTVDWDGDYTSPGFLFDNVNIQQWQPFTDYKSGDIVSYRSYNWTSLVNQLGSESFNDTGWVKLDSTPEKQLVANFDYKINQFEDYYNVDADGLGNSQRELARHAIGYQVRTYLQNLAEDPVTQFQLYQGFIREKGSANAISKVFNKLSSSGKAGVVLNEEWAFRVGRLGGTDQLTETELTLYKDQFTINPQPIEIVQSKPLNITDQIYRIEKSNFTIDSNQFSNDVNPVTTDSLLARTAGYVKTDQIDFVVKTRDALLDLDISLVQENNHIWVTFDDYSWNVLRYNMSPTLIVSSLEKVNNQVTIGLGRSHSIVDGDVVGIKNILNLTGFFKVVATEFKSITVEVPDGAQDPEWDLSTVVNLNLLTEARFATYDDINDQTAALLRTGSKLWIDDNLHNGWEVVEKKKQFVSKELTDSGISDSQHLGTNVLYSLKNKQVITSTPDTGYVVVYVETNSGLALKQLLVPPEAIRTNVLGSFGTKMAISSDGKWLIVGSPTAGSIPSFYKGEFNPASTYLTSDIVSYDNRLWEATADLATPEYPDVASTDWQSITSIAASSQGTSAGYSNQGVITIYEWSGQRWGEYGSFVSPRAAAGELFGSSIAIGQTNGTYYAAVSAPGALAEKGRVYLFECNGTDWSTLVVNSTQFALPQQIAYGPDGSTVGGLAEILKDGDQYGISMTMSNDASILVVGAPYSDGQYFENYKGWWKVDTEYTDGDVVKFENNYYRLFDPRDHEEDWDSTILYTNTGTEPGETPWENIGDSTTNQSGKVFVYKRDIDNSFQLMQTIDAGSLVFLDDTPTKVNSRAIETRALNNAVVVKNTAGMVPNMPILFTGASFGELVSGTTYYIKEILRPGVNGTITISKKFSGSVLSLTDATGSLDIIAGGTPDVAVGDQFGFSVDLDYTGSILVVSSPKADINFQNQGSAYVFLADDLDSVEYRLKQKLESFEQYPNEYYGQCVSISSTGERIAIGAKNTPFMVLAALDATIGTTFDQERTRFTERNGYAGAVYVYEKKNSRYLLVEKLEAELSPFESFGYSLDCTDSVIVVGSPDYRVPAQHLATVAFDGPTIGTVRLFVKDEELNSWETLATQEALVDIRKIQSIALYDNTNNIKIQDVDYIDHAKLKILNSAEKEIKFKTLYDPAVYTIGTDEQTVDSDIAWAEKHVGELWWDLSTAKWKYYEQGDIFYRTSSWNALAEGASIDVYEWVQTPLLPNEWAALADTNEGISEGISGQPLHPNNDVYTVKEIYSETTGLPTGTIYFYWVKGKTVIPTNMVGRTISSASVASYISNPVGSGTPFIAVVGTDKFIAYNFDSIISNDTALLNIQYSKNSDKLNPIHNEYQLLTEGVADSLPTEKLENKWIDSLVGSDQAGNTVPDVNLPAKQKYGLEFRPRQSMFIDRLPILKTSIENINTVLTKEPFADLAEFGNLNLVDEIPSPLLNLYDTEVDTEFDLNNVGTVRIRQATLSVNIVNGEVDTIDIVDPGQGYRNAPPVVIQGNGIGAKATVTLDNQGRVNSVTVVLRGKKYSSAIATVRQFSVLVRNDSTVNNFWAIYAWDNERETFFKSRTQAFDTTRYWSYADWWKDGYSENSRVVVEIQTIFEEATLQTSVGDLIRVKEYGTGGWAVFEKVSTTGQIFSDNFLLVGREQGTIKFSELLYNTQLSGIGYDNTQAFDIKIYDIENSKELRNILRAVKEDIFTGEYSVEWNKLFFTSIRYAFAEQQYIDWAFKTSFLNATHNVGLLSQKLNYKNDNLESFQDYINEVKPFRTTVREYVSNYDATEQVGAATSDFDLPPKYSAAEGAVMPVTLSSVEANTYPWKWWTDNYKYSIVSIEVSDPGANYIQPPSVLIEGDGTGAVAQAYISNGVVSGIRVINGGSGFTKAPTIRLVGGNGSNDTVASAVAVIGNTLARTFNLGIKFDRLSKEGLYSNFVQSEETIVANGYSATFELSYAPTRDKTKIQILKNNQLVLNNEYSVTLYKSSTDTYSLLKGKIVFAEVPLQGDVINISYEKNDELLDSVNRIQKFYAPNAGMKGKDLGQLMTGIDFGGVQVQGTTFDVTGGWDALPWFTDNWDSVESSADYYVVCDGSTTSITLPYVPAEGQEITIYIKRTSSEHLSTPPRDRTNVLGLLVRIDDPNYTNSWDSTSVVNPHAQMPTFVGDGVTNVVEIGQYIQTNAGDTLIFRPIESDGSVTITDPNLLDTQISGGTLANVSSAYSTATGLSAEDISIDGGNFISPDQVPATEENVPGQVLDSVSIKVFTADAEGSTPLNTRVYYGDGTTTVFDIGLSISENTSLMVYIDKEKKEFFSDSTVDYVINFENNTVEFTVAPTINSLIELISVGVGGVNLLDYQEFVADGETSLFLTNARFADTSLVYVTVNGVYENTGFIDSTEELDIDNKTLVRFGFTPAADSRIKIVAIGQAAESTGIVRTFQQVFEFEGSTRSFEITDYVIQPSGSPEASVIVEANGQILKGVDTIYKIYDGSTNQFVIAVDPEEGPGAVLATNIKVFVNNQLKTFIQDYVYDGAEKLITITSTLVEGDIIKIENNFRAQYSIDSDSSVAVLTILDDVALNSTSESDNDIIKLTWFSEYPSMKIVSDEFTGGKVNYTLGFTPLAASYVWVYKNGIRLTQDVDYAVSIPRGVVYLKDATTVNDSVKIVLFGSKVYSNPSAYEIHKDMLNVYHFSRFSQTSVKLAQELKYYDQQIVVTDASNLADPIVSRNLPGVVLINNERIEYLQKSGNILSQLRRGVQGTAIAELHNVESYVVDVSNVESIPYKENQEKVDFVSDGSTLIVGPLDYTPAARRNEEGTLVDFIYTETIPIGYYPCDQVEVFVAGRRLRKDPVSIFSEDIGASSPAADITIEAEFSVDDATGYIRLTDKVPAGTRVSVIRKVGYTWYERADDAISKGLTLVENNTPIAAFIAKKTTTLPE